MSACGGELGKLQAVCDTELLRYARVSKETYSYGKRDLFIWQKRPIHVAKEVY